MQDILDLVVQETGYYYNPTIELNRTLNDNVAIPTFQTESEKQEPCAIVGYGPSLLETYELLEQFSVIISCSGSHRFLLERGIAPTYHVEVDPGEAKAKFTGVSSADTTYLISDTCSPLVFKQLLEKKRKILKFGYSVGLDVGHQAIHMATELGYRDIHLVGFDGSGLYAGEHNKKVQNISVKCGDLEFVSDRDLIHSVLYFPILMSQLPKGTTLSFSGEGLLQAYLSRINNQK